MAWDNSSDNDTTVFLGDTSGSIMGAVIVLVILAVLIWWLNARGQENDRKILAYINAHNCKITNYVGGSSKRSAVYQCDNGEKLDFDLRKEALK